MLKILRNQANQKKIYLFLAVLIVPSFLIWGVTLDKSGKPVGGVVGHIGKKKVTVSEFIRAYESLRTQLILFQGSDLSKFKGMDFEKAAWDRILLINEAGKRKIKVSNKEVIDWVRNQEIFSPGGVFNPDIYNRFIDRQFRMSARQFEEEIRGFLTVQKIIAELTPPVNVSEEDAKKLFKARTSTRDLSYVFLSYEGAAAAEPPTEEELKKLYEPLQNVLLKPDGTKIPYEEAKADLTAKLTEGKKREKLFADAQAIRKEMGEKGFDAAAAARQLSVQTAKDQKPGDALDTAGVFSNTQEYLALVKDGISEPLEADKGYVIVRVDAVKEAEGWDKAKDGIMEELRQQQERSAYETAMQKLWSELKVERRTLDAILPKTKADDTPPAPPPAPAK